MSSQQDATRALNLAGQVLRSEMSLDEALLVANASGIVGPLIESLNVLANAPLFNQSELEMRLLSGEAQFAVEGRIPKLQLPSDLLLRKTAEAPALNEALDLRLKDLDHRAAQLQDAELDIRNQLEFLQAIEKGRSALPNPWLPGVIILTIGLILSAVGGMVAQSGPAAFGIMIVMIALAALVFMRDAKKYEVHKQRTAREYDHRRQKKDQCLKDLDTVQNELAVLMQEAGKVLSHLEISGEEVRQKAIITYPRLFWMTFNPHTRNED
ncbi:MAG: hypothetical protein UZ16_OP3001000230 [Candidatus Hinthialibacteria bacterium OLB16]|nr:MAG: hypothetical protein UZ16_OP3001000230 [Candidatus Hinthialibacteria bacterium OLB16]